MRKMDLDHERVEEAVGALVPYVERWNLPLNPENLRELAYVAIQAYLEQRDGP